MNSTRLNALTVRFSDEELMLLRRLADKHDRSAGSVLRIALRSFAERRGSGGGKDKVEAEAESRTR